MKSFACPPEFHKMAYFGKLFLLTTVCWSCFLPSVLSQGYHQLYKSKDVTNYEIKNGKYRIITTTTPPPSLMETFFPWTGSAYNSVRTPEEDAAILSSLSDPEPPSSSSSSSSPSSSSVTDGIMSWFGYGSSNNNSPSSQNQNQPPQGYPPYNNYPQPSPIYYPPISMISAGSNVEPVVVPPPGAENQVGMDFAPMDYGSPPPPFPGTGDMNGPPPPFSGPGDMNGPPPPFSGPGDMGGMPYPSPIDMRDAPPSYPGPLDMNGPPPPPPMQMGPPRPPPMQMGPPPPLPPQDSYYDIPKEIRGNLNPTFQFHQQVKDSIPIPSPSLPGFGPSMFPPYLHQPGSNLDFVKSTTERPSSYFDIISNYFTFGKRSDLGNKDVAAKGENVMQARSMDGEEEYEVEALEENEDEEPEPEVKESTETEETNETAAPAPPSPDGTFPCPKSGIWRWNGEVCIAVGPVPIWACRPNDLTVSGKIAICRNKIYFSPKVITNAIP